MTDELKTTITKTLEHASRDALETLFDAAVFEEHLALVIEGIDDVMLEREITELLMTCHVVPEDEGTFLFSSLEGLRFFMAEITRLVEVPQAIENDEFIVFNASSLTAPEILPDDDAESLLLEHSGYQLRKISHAKIQIVPANNPRTKTERAGVVRLARNIATRGLQQPVTVRSKLETEDCFELVFGYRRMAAIQYAIAQGWLPEDFDVICIVRRLNDSQVRLAALSENEEREEVNLLDQAEGWAKLRLTQTEASIANAAGIPISSVKRCLKVAFGVCEEAKTLHCEGKLLWGALIAFSYGSLEVQRAYLSNAGNALWKLAAENVKQAMTLSDFKFANARFSLEEYETAGGQLEMDLWGSTEGTRLLSRDVIERLQSAWAQHQVRELQAQGFAFVELRSGEWTWWSEFNRVTRATPGAGAIVHVRSDWALDVIEHVLPIQANLSNTSSSPNSIPSFDPNTSSAMPSKPEEPKTDFSEAGITLVRRTRTAALQQAILENTNPKLPLALTVLGFLGEPEVRLKISNLGDVDAITSSVILAEFETVAARVPNLSFSPSSGLVFASSIHRSPEKRIETLNTLLNLPKPELERLHRLLVATMVGDFASATEGQLESRRRKLKVDSLISSLAEHLGVKGGEALEISEDYLKTIGFRKAKLSPYLAAAFGEQLVSALLENPKAKIIAELLTHKDKFPKDFTPPELSFAANSSAMIGKLEVVEIDDFADDDKNLESDPNLIREEDLSFLDSLEPSSAETVAADD